MLSKDLYTIDLVTENRAIITLSDETHPVFKAHFPTKPILPGFMNFDIVEELFDMKITTIKKAKFLKTITPNQTLTYERNKNNFKVFCEDEVVVSFSL
jgi:3-hydroxyacyl-[acyl-carrier-protein] dehydratase